VSNEKQKVIVFIHELGASILDESLEVIKNLAFEEDPVTEYELALRGEGPLFKRIIESLGEIKAKRVYFQTSEMVERFRGNAKLISGETMAKVVKNKFEILLKSKFVEDEKELVRAIREFALRFGEREIRKAYATLDTHVIQAVRALDDLDKTINLLGLRLKEWYIAHFPEITEFISDPLDLSNFVLKVGMRSNVTEEEILGFPLPEAKRKALITAASKSKGAEIECEEFDKLRGIAKEVQELSNLRKKLAEYIEKTADKIAPNISSLVGATIGARFLSLAGGLEKMSMLPASKIQVLGAEKALFRSLKTGSRPPKHGIIFQHPEVHGAPKRLRGKIARAMAAKLSIAAKIDFYRKELEPSLKADLEERINEIKATLRRAPKWK